MFVFEQTRTNTSVRLYECSFLPTATEPIQLCKLINQKINELDDVPVLDELPKNIANMADLDGFEELSDQTSSNIVNISDECEEFTESEDDETAETMDHETDVEETENSETDDETDNNEMDDAEAKRIFDETLKKCYDHYMKSDLDKTKK